MNVRDRLRARLREIRRERGMSQGALASALDIQPRQVSNYERGVSTPKLDRLERFADALGVDVSEFFRLPTALTQHRDVEQLVAYVKESCDRDPKLAKRLLKILRALE